MRYVVIPPAVEVDTVTLPDGKHPQISFVKLVREVLVTHTKVTEGDETIGRFLEIAEKVVAPVGSVVAFTDEEHELLSLLARTMQYSPDAKLPILRLVKAITGATPKAPVIVEPAG